MYPSNVFAQFTLNTTGTDILSKYGTVSNSIGEVFFIHKGLSYSLSEGIQFGTIVNKIVTKSNVHVLVYPNPTNDLLFFKVENLNFNNLSYHLYNNIGIELLNGIITSTNTFVSIKQFPDAIYYIKVYKSKTEIITYQIIKIK